MPYILSKPTLLFAGVECGPSNVFVTRSPIGPIEHGENLTLTCSAHDPTRSGLIYQWFKDGNVIPGKSLPTLMLSEVGLNNEGVYTCRVSNRVGEGKANDSILVIGELVECCHEC